MRERAAELVDVAACVELLREADGLVQRTGGETTAVLLVIDDGGLYGASCGDSEAWLVKDGGAVDDLTENQHLKRRVGSGRAVPVGFERDGPLRGVLVVGSDGLYRYAKVADIVNTVLSSATTADEAAEALVELVRTRSGDLLDDFAVVILWFDSSV